ncbi:MAG: condensation domain-containing protein, partial [Cellvibrio sp.]
FKMVGDEPRQIIADHSYFDIPVRDISGENADQLDAIIQQLNNDEADKPFNLSEAPMMRASLLRLANDKHLMLLTVHHIATDAWSSDVLTREFVAAYTAYSQGKTPELTALSIQYGDYAHWQRSEAQQKVLSRSLDHWRKQLDGVPHLLKLPLDHVRPRVADYEGAVVSHPISAEHIRRLKAYGQKTGSTLFMVMLNAFNSLLQRATGAQDFIVGTDLANREHPALESLIGFFVNVLPLRAQLNAGENFAARLEKLRTNTLDAFQHQSVPFDSLVEMLQPERQTGVNPLVQVLFVMQNTPATIAELPGLVLEEISAGQETCKFDLAVFVDEDEQKNVRVYWKYRRSLFNEETIKHLQTGFEELVALVANNPDEALAKWQWQSKTQQQNAAAAADEENSKAARKQSKLNKLKTTRVTAVSKAPEEQVKTSTFGATANDGTSLPLVIEPLLAELDAVLWARECKPWIENLLRIHGGLLFRGFNVPDAQAFEAFAQAIEPALYGQYGDLPKNKSGKNIYHSTPYPEQQMILFHNESSHLSQWPKKQWFYCEIPARKGGCTPIVDCRKVYQQLPAHILAPLEEKGLLYVRHFTDKLDVRWQDFFKTESRAEAEQQCRNSGMGFEWFGTDNLRTEQLCPAVVEHPETGEKVFFNQVQLHHEACLEPEVRRNLISLFGADRLPRNVYYGDGTRISDADMEEIGRVYEACAVRFQWQKRDLIMLDNMSVAHARDPFEGERKICVAMGQMYQREDLASINAAKKHEAANAGQEQKNAEHKIKGVANELTETL